MNRTGSRSRRWRRGLLARSAPGVRPECARSAPGVRPECAQSAPRVDARKSLSRNSTTYRRHPSARRPGPPAIRRADPSRLTSPTAVPMSRFLLASTLAASCLLALPVPRAAHAQVVTLTAATTIDTLVIDASLARARQRATEGDLAGARVLLDSLAAVAEPGSGRLAEVLFWRATYAQTAAGAERDYRRIVVEHPMS